MCTVCGCGAGAQADSAVDEPSETGDEAVAPGPLFGPTGRGRRSWLGQMGRRHHGDGHVHHHEHGDRHPHVHPHHAHHPKTRGVLEDAWDPGEGTGGRGTGDLSPAPGAVARRRVLVEQDILAENDRLAATNRTALASRGTVALNLMSAPGSGKTTLLVRTIEENRRRLPICVVEGDQETSFDAERIRATGANAIQINTGRGCHLDARMVADALPALQPPSGAVIFIENVGNLVCPAGFDLGENARVVLLSVTEGDDKPLKYANMFAHADLLLLTKIDLLPFVPFDPERCATHARRINPRIEILPVSASSGEGMRRWYEWIDRRRTQMPALATGTGQR